MNFRELLLRALVAFVALHIVSIFTPVTPYGLLFALLISAAILLIDYRNGLLLVFSSSMLVVILEAIVRLSGGSVITPYYRAHEMLAEETRYRENQRVEMIEPHGDLLAIDPQLDREMARPKEMTFQTDSRGFRNESEFEAGDLVVVGDSFVVGIGNTQKYTITAQLTRNHGVAAYNMGFPAGPFQYANTVAEARSELGAGICIVLVMFEGNDFQIIDPAELAARKAVPRGIQDFIKGYFGAIKAPFEVSKVFFGLFSQGIERLRLLLDNDPEQVADTAADVTFVRNVAGKPMVFLKGYAEVVMRDSYADFDYIHEQFARATPDLIVFAPDKYRVYGPLLDDDSVHDLPQAQLEHLARVATELKIPLLDLTEALDQRTRSLLGRGDLTYWRDDTHWNPVGIEVAANEIAQVLPSHKKAACRQAYSGRRSIPE
jgi:hypothetical protein